MAGAKYTSVNVLVEQHAQLKRIADFKGLKITDLGVEMAGKYIEEFNSKHGDMMEELEGLEKRMSELRSRFSNE